MKKIIEFVTFSVLFFMLTTLLPAQQPIKSPDWESWRFLLGEWVGEGGGSQPGQGSGGSTFYLALQDKIMVRKNHSEFPATKDKAAYAHDDVTIIYPENGKTRAIYFDNEGHVINYTAEFSEDHNTLIFISDIQPSLPRFRLSYIKSANDTLKLKFEIAPPGTPEAFSPYIESALRRK